MKKTYRTNFSFNGTLLRIQAVTDVLFSVPGLYVANYLLGSAMLRAQAAVVDFAAPLLGEEHDALVARVRKIVSNGLEVVDAGYAAWREFGTPEAVRQATFAVQHAQGNPFVVEVGQEDLQ